MPPPKPLVLFVTSEVYPYSKTGGLGDARGALPLELHRMGVNTAVITPFYGRLKTADYGVRLMYSDCPVRYPWEPVPADIYLSDFHGVPVYLVHRAEYFDRRGYYNTHKGDYFDNCERFIFFCKAVLEFCRLLSTPPAIIHAHDWQAALTPAYLHFLRGSDPIWTNTRSILTIHNLAFQGRFSSRLFWESGLPPHAWSIDGVEFFGDFNLLKAGISYSDRITTVSPSYSSEICFDKYGCGLEGALSRRASDLTGIINGADYEVWNPENDIFLPSTYSEHSLEGKQACKEHLLRELGMDPALNCRPVLGFIGRLREQKGVDLLIAILPDLMKLDVGVVILGEGDLILDARILGLMEEYPGRLSALVSYTEDLAHRIQAGADIFLMPSRYEPCGLTQMYSLRYGAPPVATAVGGLRDTIVPWPDENATGFHFQEPEPLSFYSAVREAVLLFDKKVIWDGIRKRAMGQRFLWSDSARKYI